MTYRTIKILELSSELDGGGVDRLLYDYCSRMIPELQFDFVVTSKEEGILERPLKDLGCNVYHIAQMHENLGLHIKQLKEIFTQSKYDMVHAHGAYRSFFTMLAAKQCGIKTRISHSHVAYVPETVREKLERKIFTPLTKLYATDLFACGEDAAKWMWGESAFNSGKVHIMRNAINTKQFAFSEEKRNAIRKELGIEDKFVIGNVARFAYQKNHEFLINIFAEIKKLRSDAILMLVGRGELEDDVRAQVKELGIEKNVLFLGVRNDVPDLLNAMDIFLLPSRFEGLGIVYVEAQANGLKCFASENVVPEEANVCGGVTYISLNDSANAWARKIVDADNRRNEFGVKTVIKNGYDIETEAEKMKKEYKALCGK